jgi:hypothetical protein
MEAAHKPFRFAEDGLGSYAMHLLPICPVIPHSSHLNGA